MEKVRCPGWPACVEEIYEKAMARYDAEGCFLTDPAYYTSLAERYGIFQTELDTFQRAAVAVGQSSNIDKVSCKEPKNANKERFSARTVIFFISF